MFIIDIVSILSFFHPYTQYTISAFMLIIILTLTLPVTLVYSSPWSDPSHHGCSSADFYDVRVHNELVFVDPKFINFIVEDTATRHIKRKAVISCIVFRSLLSTNNAGLVISIVSKATALSGCKPFFLGCFSE